MKRDKQAKRLCLAAFVELLVTAVASIVLLAVASVALAATCENKQARSETHSTLLPDCRAYELVTPAFKEGVAPGVPLLSADGSHLIDGSVGIFAGAEQNDRGAIGGTIPGAYYELNRTPTGWVTTPMTPPSASEFPSAGMQSDVSADFSRTLWKLRSPFEPEGMGELYRREADGTFVRIGPLQRSDEQPRFGSEGEYLGASGDMSHILLAKLPGQGRWPGDTTTGNESLYEYPGVSQREPALVGVSNTGKLASNLEAKLISQCGTLFGSGSSGSDERALSSEGTIVFFTASECQGVPAVNELYARVNESHTVAVSEPVLAPGECTAACATAEHKEGRFEGASEDGSRVFFRTEQPLLNRDKDATADLYMAELSSNRVARLVMVSEGEARGASSENDPALGEGADVLGVARVSAAGNLVYYVATGVLTKAANSAGEVAQADANNLYVTDVVSGRTTFIASLSGDDEAIWNKQNVERPFAITEDGIHAVFVSHADATREGTTGAQVYQYDQVSHLLSRVSLGQHSNSFLTTPRIVVPSYAQIQAADEVNSKRTMSADGSFVFFESPDGLTPNAPDDAVIGCGFEFEGQCFLNAYAQNIYEYHDGQVSFIATTYAKNSFGAGGSQELIGTDASGADVYFSTSQALVTQDTDTQVDIYDARVNGGFPRLQASVPCSGDSCHGPLASQPAFTAPASEAQQGEAQLAPSKTTSRAKPLAQALRVCSRKRRRRQRLACEVRERERYGVRTSKHSLKRSASGGLRRGDGHAV